MTDKQALKLLPPNKWQWTECLGCFEPKDYMNIPGINIEWSFGRWKAWIEYIEDWDETYTNLPYAALVAAIHIHGHPKLLKRYIRERYKSPSPKCKECEEDKGPTR